MSPQRSVAMLIRLPAKGYAHVSRYETKRLRAHVHFLHLAINASNSQSLHSQTGPPYSMTKSMSIQG
jgi:hypothetical protein